MLSTLLTSEFGVPQGVTTNIVQSMCRRYVANITRKQMFTICRWYSTIQSMQNKSNTCMYQQYWERYYTNWLLGKELPSLVSFTRKMSTFPLISADIESNLFQSEFIFRCPEITFLG